MNEAIEVLGSEKLDSEAACEMKKRRKNMELKGN